MDEVVKELPAQVREVAHALATWHDLGFRHGNAYPKNVLQTAQSVLVPIGCPAASFTGPGKRPDRAQVKDVAQMLAGLGAIDRSLEIPLLEHYTQTANISTAKLASRVRPHVERIFAKKRARGPRPTDGPKPL